VNLIEIIFNIPGFNKCTPFEIHCLLISTLFGIVIYPRTLVNTNSFVYSYNIRKLSMTPRFHRCGVLYRLGENNHRDRVLCYSCVNVCVIVYETHGAELDMIDAAAVGTIVITR
jgi:hypothetical protein